MLSARTTDECKTAAQAVQCCDTMEAPKSGFAAEDKLTSLSTVNCLPNRLPNSCTQIMLQHQPQTLYTYAPSTSMHVAGHVHKPISCHKTIQAHALSII